VTRNVSVYIIEDDPVIRDCVCDLMQDIGLDVKAYASALDFVAAVEPQEKGCVVTDLSMPGMSGFALLSYIEQRGFPLSVVVITGHADDSLAVQAMKNGAFDFIKKPFAGDELIAVVRLALAHQGGDNFTSH
jgi:two-component system response regulator FixJ